MSTAARVIKQVTITSAIGAAVLAASASSAFAQDAAPSVSAAAHVRYTVSGTTAIVTPYLTGTQHEMQDRSGAHVRSVLPESFDFTAPASAKWVSGNSAADSGEIVCGTTGSVPLASQSLSATPIVLRFPGPGTYPVTLSAYVCTPQHTVTKTVNITIPAAGAHSGTTTTTPKETIAKEVAAAKAGKNGPVGQQGIPAAPGEKEAKARAAAAGSAPVVGPHVETDRQVQGSDSTMLWGLAGLAGLSAAGGTSILAARRRG